MAKERILAVDDEADILELIGYNLSREGYRIDTARTGEEALASIRDRKPDLVILDLMLPGIDGLEVCRRIRNDPSSASISIVMLTAKGEDADIVAGLELGADDYITKPFSPRVLLARIRAVLRREHEGGEGGSAVVRAGGIAVNPATREVTVEGTPVELTASEFNILSYLVRRPGWVFTRNQIIEAVHGEDYPVTERSIDVQIVGLRKKLGEAGKHIQTVRGIGYRFKE
jgi:two-component system, OmpR family, alkaline phosphatase synthesis response regulator PhoP